MKKLLVSMMLILGMLAFAAESAPSATVGYVKYDCVTTAGADQNMIAYPVDAGYTNVSAIDPTATYVNVINKWNAATQSYSGTSYNTFLSMWLGDYPIEVGQVYMVNALSNHSIIVDGDVVVTPSYNLITTAGADQNLIMHPLDKAALTMAGAGIGNDIGACNVVNQWNAATQSYSGTSYNTFLSMWLGDYATEIGNPLLVNVTSDVTWPGAKGSMVDGEVPATPKMPSKPIYFAVQDQFGAYYDFSGAPYDNVSGAAWFEPRPTEILTTESGLIVRMDAGGISAFYFDTSAFASDWVTGENLVIHAYDETTMYGGAVTITTMDTGDLGPLMGGIGDPVYVNPILADQDESGIDGTMPLETKLDQNYPNPFNPTTTINFSLKSEGIAKLNVYNYTGQLVNSLVNGTMEAGYHTVNFDASNLSAGVYYYTLEANNMTMTNKMVLVK